MSKENEMRRKFLKMIHDAQRRGEIKMPEKSSLIVGYYCDDDGNSIMPESKQKSTTDLY